MVLPKKQEQIERMVAYYLEVLRREFDSGQLCEEYVCNADKPHLCINFYNHKKLAFIVDTHVKYTNAVSGDEGMTMMLTICGGCKAFLESLIIIFKNINSNHPTSGLLDDVMGLCYRIDPKKWMDARVFLEYIKKRRALSSFPNMRKGVM